MDQLSGILPAVVTPFDDGGRFDAPAFERLLERVYTAGVHGVYICGTTGEGMLQAADERQRVTDAAVAATPAGRSVVVHVGASSIDEAAALARHAARAGAHAISSLPPMSASFSFAEVSRYYAALARASDLPLVVYYFPELCSSIGTADELEALCGLPNVVGVKFTDVDLYKLSLIVRPGRHLFNGRDEVLAAGLLMGADGGIGSFYNVVPELFVRIHAAAGAGRWEDARELQRQVNRLIRLTLRFPLLPAIKQMLAWSGHDCGTCLPPRAALDDAQRQALRTALLAEGFEELASPGL